MSRVPSRYGANLHDSMGSAIAEARELLRIGAPFWVFRTADDLYDWSAIPDPKSPWFRDATLVHVAGGPR